MGSGRVGWGGALEAADDLDLCARLGAVESSRQQLEGSAVLLDQRLEKLEQGCWEWSDPS